MVEGSISPLGHSIQSRGLQVSRSGVCPRKSTASGVTIYRLQWEEEVATVLSFLFAPPSVTHIECLPWDVIPLRLHHAYPRAADCCSTQKGTMHLLKTLFEEKGEAEVLFCFFN